MPYGEYYGKLGITYTPSIPTGQKAAWLGMRPTFVDNKFRLTNLASPLLQAGLQESDEWVAFNNQPVSLDNIAKVQAALKQLKPGDAYEIAVRRNGQDTTVKSTMLEKEVVQQYVFKVDQQATPQQVQLREIWQRNL